jgi:hypothetical protein
MFDFAHNSQPFIFLVAVVIVSPLNYCVSLRRKTDRSSPHPLDRWTLGLGPHLVAFHSGGPYGSISGDMWWPTNIFSFHCYVPYVCHTPCHRVFPYFRIHISSYHLC